MWHVGVPSEVSLVDRWRVQVCLRPMADGPGPSKNSLHIVDRTSRNGMLNIRATPNVLAKQAATTIVVTSISFSSASQGKKCT